MGACSSSSKDSSNDGSSAPAPNSADAAEIAKRQRRRLSVSPQHVGDITKAQQAAGINGGSAMNGNEDAKAAELIEGYSVPGMFNFTEMEMKSKGSLIHAFRSRKVFIPYNKNKVNQDRLILKYGLGGDLGIQLFGVMDGHGEFGHLVAAFVQENLPIALASQANLRTDAEKAIHEAVRKTCEQLSETNINIAFSGTTCVFGLKVDNTLYVANIGDSRCVLCRQGADNDIQAIGLTWDQKPDHPTEKARIIAAGGRVESLPGNPGEDTGPPRVWLAEVDVPGLAMSRSIGDEVSQTVGVTSVPEIQIHKIDSNDIFAIWASDGVWEFISNEEACGIVWKYKDNVQEAANQLAEESTKMWKKEEEVIDDITVVIIQFNQFRK